MSCLLQKSFHLNLFVMRLVGLFPSNRCSVLYKVYSYIIYTVSIIFITVLASVYLLKTPINDLSEITDNLFLLVQVGVLVLKLLPFLRNSEQVKSTLNQLNSPLFNGFTHKQEVIIGDCVRTCRRLSYLFLLCCILDVASWGLKPILLQLHKTPVDVWVPYDIETNPKLYYATYIYVFLGVGYGAISNGAVDPLIAGLAYNATAQIRILKDNLQHLGKDANAEIFKDNRNVVGGSELELLLSQIIYKKICNCIDHHTAILNFIKSYEDTFSVSIFWQFLASFLVICTSAYQLTTMVPYSMPFVTMLFFLLTILSEIFLYTYYGTVLYTESDSITTAIYMSTWYEYDMKCKRTLIILMENSKMPIVLTAEKILDLSLETFTMIIKKAYSLFAILEKYNKN